MIWLELFTMVFGGVFVFSILSELSYRRTPARQVFNPEFLRRKALWTLMMTVVLLVSTLVWHLSGWDAKR